jgi:hypothetical protein
MKAAAKYLGGKTGKPVTACMISRTLDGKPGGVHGVDISETPPKPKPCEAELMLMGTEADNRNEKAAARKPLLRYGFKERPIDRGIPPVWK